MYTASLELCKELYELGGWDETHHRWSKDIHGNDVVIDTTAAGATIPAYDLGYLLRKVYTWGPVIRLEPIDLEARPDAHKNAYFVWVLQHDIDIRVWADTPENAACRVAIELFKQGVLKPLKIDDRQG